MPDVLATALNPAQTTLVLRLVKGTGLTNAEGDSNFSNLNAGKYDVQNNLGDVTNVPLAQTNLGVPDVAITYAIALG
jgi:hypothetical protein